jgi:hypothetical protein
MDKIVKVKVVIKNWVKYLMGHPPTCILSDNVDVCEDCEFKKACPYYFKMIKNKNKNKN